MREILRLDRVCRTQGSRTLLRDLSFAVGAGEGLALVGPSGIGKTTVLRIVAGLEPADAGEVWIAGHRATHERRILVPPHRRGIGFVFQDLALWPHMTVTQSLEFVLQSTLRSVGALDKSQMIREMFRLVRLENLGDRYPHQLSGGEQQRAALARALVHRPALTLLDEPLTGLDDDLRRELRTMLSELRATLGFAMVFVTHDRVEATAVSDRIVRLG
jgi:ABC-type Fe3+/spermidine/putrescine transport system ATPase subunit